MFIINRGSYPEVLYQVLVGWTIEHVEVWYEVLRLIVTFDVATMV